MIDELVKRYRRYSKGKWPDYDFYFKDWLNRSFIQEQDQQIGSRTIPVDTTDLEVLESLFKAYVDHGNSITDNRGVPDPSQRLNTMEDARAQVERFKMQVKRDKQRAANEGRPFKYTPSKEQLQCEAYYDIKLIEKDWLENRIVELRKEDEDDDSEERKKLMKRSPLGKVSKINYETGHGHFSYMKVAPLNGDGLVCIIDPISPFNGMSVLDLREFVLPIYKLEQKKLYRERMAAWEALTAEEKAKRKKPIGPEWMLPKWPKWPEGITNHLQVTASKKLIRTK